MEKTAVQKLAGALKVLVSITFVCNLLVLPLLAGLARLRSLEELTAGISYFGAEGEKGGIIILRLAAYFLASWQEIWLLEETYALVLTAFLLFCGVCTAVVLWQARRTRCWRACPFRRRTAKASGWLRFAASSSPPLLWCG